MSHQQGKVTWPGERDTVLGLFEYNGTVDVAMTAIHPSAGVLWQHWRTDGNRRECTCGEPPTPVRLIADYGGGVEWDSEACLVCGAITGTLSPYMEASK